ncbi:hypothetical protein [Gaetbulibacter sp. NE]|uniref:hypothetical protein n=1 Tax=Gaetbulibacter sp. NE TaxID=2982307 RepID=UPI0021D27A97|nr:hypothetical protein [Gaetbulibacter sp. NE]
MTIFPVKFYEIEFQNSLKALNEIKSRTIPKNIFISNWNNQIFIGEVTNKQFTVKLSKKILGLFCTFHGKIENEVVFLKIEFHRYTKTFFSLLFITILSLIPLSIILKQPDKFAGLLIHLLIIRYIYIELLFKFCSKKGLKELKNINGFKSITETNNFTELTEK